MKDSLRTKRFWRLYAVELQLSESPKYGTAFQQIGIVFLRLET